MSNQQSMTRVPCFIFGLRSPIACDTLCLGQVMLDFIKFFLPFVAVLFALLYVFLINPDVLTAFGWWLRDTF